MVSVACRDFFCRMLIESFKIFYFSWVKKKIICTNISGYSKNIYIKIEKNNLDYEIFFLFIRRNNNYCAIIYSILKLI